MFPDYDIFKHEFPKYTDGYVQCVDGVVKRIDGGRLISVSADQEFFSFFSRIREGDTIQECWLVWRELLRNSKSRAWLIFDVKELPANSAWITKDGEPRRLYNGFVTRGHSSDGMRLDMSRPIKLALNKIPIGASAEEALERIRSAQGYKRYERLRDFHPSTRTVTKSATLTLMDNKVTPEFLSTHLHDVRVFYPGDDHNKRPDGFQVVMYALTRIWDDPARKRLSPRFKSNTQDYFNMAKKFLLRSDYIQRHKDILPHIEFGRMRVTYDCCIEVDFTVK